MNSNKNKVGLILTVFNEAINIKQFLDSLSIQTKIPDEIVILDGGSTDGTEKIITDFISNNSLDNFRLVKVDKRCNIAEGRNKAISLIGTEIVAVTDAGCVLNRDWFERITLPLLKYQDLDVVSGWYEPRCYNDFQKKFSEITIPKLSDVNKKTFLPSSRSIAFRKSAWADVGGYPEYLTLSAEDTLFDIKLIKLNKKFFFEPLAIVQWEPRDTLKKALWIHFSMGRGDAEAALFNTKYLFFFIAIFLPFLYAFTKKKFNFFGLRYLLKLAATLGWFVGLWNRFFIK